MGGSDLYSFVNRLYRLEVSLRCGMEDHIKPSRLHMASRHSTSANWFDKIMTFHDMSPNVTVLN